MVECVLERKLECDHDGSVQQRVVVKDRPVKCSIMVFMHRKSCEGAKSELNLFGMRPNQTSIDAGQWVEHQPITSLDSCDPFEILLPGSGDAYQDLAHTYQFVRAKVTTGNERTSTRTSWRVR